MDYERTRLQKAVLWALLALAVIFTAINIILKFFPGVAFEGTLLDIDRDGARTVYTGERYGDDITIVTYPEGTGHVVELTIGNTIDHTYRVEYPGGTIKAAFGTYERLTITRVRDGDVVKIIFDGGYDPDAASMKFCGPDGEALSPYSFSVTTSNDPWRNFELTRGQVMAFANGPETTTRGSWVHFIAALIVSAIGAVCAAFPRTLFYIQHALSVQDPEPTDFYLKMQEISGAVIVVLVFIVYIIGVTKIV